MKITSEITTNMTTVNSIRLKPCDRYPSGKDRYEQPHCSRQQDVHIEIIWQSSHTLYYYIRSGIGRLHVDKADGIFLFLVDDL